MATLGPSAMRVAIPISAQVTHPLRLATRLGEPPKSSLQAKRVTYLQPKMVEISGFYRSSLDILIQSSASNDSLMQPRFSESRQQRLKKHFVQLSLQYRRFTKMLK